VSSALTAVAIAYLMIGVAHAHLTWRELDRIAEDSGHYWRMMAIIVFRWPQLIYNLWRRRP
jgi:hypothetical protein